MGSNLLDLVNEQIGLKVSKIAKFCYDSCASSIMAGSYFWLEKDGDKYRGISIDVLIPEDTFIGLPCSTSYFISRFYTAFNSLDANVENKLISLSDNAGFNSDIEERNKEPKYSIALLGQQYPSGDEYKTDELTEAFCIRINITFD